MSLPPPHVEKPHITEKAAAASVNQGKSLTMCSRSVVGSGGGEDPLVPLVPLLALALALVRFRSASRARWSEWSA
jgi:hypothetical protein